MTDRVSAEGHRYDHDGMHRHHHEYGPTGRAIWWEYADQFGGDLTEHTHADRASAEGERARIRAAVEEIIAVLGPTPPDCGCEGCRVEMQMALDNARAVLAAIDAPDATPDRADLRAAVATFLREWDAGEGDEYAMVERLRAALSAPDQPPAWFGDPNWPDSPAAPDRADPPSRAYRRERERETERRNHDAGLHITPVQTCEQCATPDRADHSATTETSDD